MSWLEDIQNNRKRQVKQMAKAFGYDDTAFQKAEEEDISEEEETSSKSKEGNAYAGKSDMYKMRMLGLRKFNDQDQKEYIGVEDADNSYITNLENGDIVISKLAEGYLVSKFPIDTENEEGDEQEAMDLSEAIDVALQFKNDLEDVKEPEQIMYKETEKSFEDEINPFEKEAWKASLSKAELDEFEKAKYADGDMHPNGKWVWRSSANGGKGDWRVASPSKRGSVGTKPSEIRTTPKKDDTKKTPNIKIVGVAEMAQALLETARASKKPYHTVVEVKGRKYSVMASSESVTVRNDLMNVVPYSNQVHKLALYEAYKDVQAKKDNKPSTSKSSNAITHDINGTKVTVTKNTDGSYTLEANGKKFKSDDPSYFVNGTNLRPSVKKALAKEVGILNKK